MAKQWDRSSKIPYVIPKTKKPKLKSNDIEVTSNVSQKYKRYQGSALFRHRIIFATLTNTSIIIDNIRNDDDNPGLKDYELSFLDLLDKITNGSLIEINESSTKIRYNPGTIIGSSYPIVFECPTSRSISYYLEPILILLLFGKQQSIIIFNGCTYHEYDINIDVIRGVFIPILKKHFGLMDIKIDLKRRALPPSGGGQVKLTVPIIKELKTINLVEMGMIKRIRGLCYTVAMAPTIANRIRTECNNVLYNYISDVWIFNDKTSKSELQKYVNKKYINSISPGYGLSLIAQTTKDVMISVSKNSIDFENDTETNNDAPITPEKFGEYMSKMLLQEISYGGTIDTTLQGTILTLMALGPPHVSRVIIGRLSKHSVHILRLIRDILGVTFKIKEDPQTGTIFVSCMGIGYKNIWRQAT